MIIKRFRGANVHGYLNINVNFYEDITFLIGINGSGKTTVVRTIHALLSPSLHTLAFTEYQEVEVEIVHEDRTVKISSSHDDKGLHLRTSATRSSLFIPKFEMPANEPQYKYRDLFLDYYRTQRSIQAEHEVYVFLNMLPTPMYLGLERREQIEKDAGPRSRYRSYRAATRRNIFAGSLADSLDEASDLAAAAFQKIQEEEDKLKDKLRNDLLLRNFTFVDTMPARRTLKFPSRSQRAAIAKQRNNVKAILESIGLSSDELRSVDDFFQKMEAIVNKLPEKPSVRKGDVENDAVVTWFFNQWQFEKVTALVALVDDFISASNTLHEPINRFLRTLNQFFNESKKRIEITRFGMQVVIGQLEPRDLSSLSSGEQQLLVLLTHLAFNPSAALASVLIIDEPELSLHIDWQERFADALLTANKNIQFILATHSPAIILERDNRCEELPGS